MRINHPSLTPERNRALRVMATTIIFASSLLSACGKEAPAVQLSPPLPQPSGATTDCDTNNNSFSKFAGDQICAVTGDLVLTGEHNQQFATDESERLPRWSPDGFQIAFVRPVGQRTQIRVLNLAAGKRKSADRLVFEVDGKVVGLSWQDFDNQISAEVVDEFGLPADISFNPLWSMPEQP